LRRINDEPHRPLQELNADVPDWLSGLVDRLLEKSRDDRWASAADVADVLGAALAHVQSPTVNPLPTELRRWADSARRRRRSLARSWRLAVAATGLALTAAVGAWWRGGTPPAPLAKGQGQPSAELAPPPVAGSQPLADISAAPAPQPSSKAPVPINVPTASPIAGVPRADELDRELQQLQLHAARVEAEWRTSAPQGSDPWHGLWQGTTGAVQTLELWETPVERRESGTPEWPSAPLPAGTAGAPPASYLRPGN
jgi:hypothetical protein